MRPSGWRWPIAAPVPVRNRLADVGWMAVIALTAVVVGVVNGAFTGFPKGYDALGHLSKIKLLVDYFPNADWNFEWYSGQLYSQGSFPALFHYAAAALVGLAHATPGTALILIAAASFVAMGWSVFGIVVVATGNRAAGVIAALVLISSAGFWLYILEGGLYPRILAMAFVSAFGFFAVLYFESASRLAYVAMVLCLAAALSTHLLLGAIGVALAVLIIATLPVTLTTKLSEGLKLLGPTALLVAYFYVPYALTLTQPGPIPVLTHEYRSLPFSSLFVPGTPGGQFESLPFFLVPLAVGAVALALIRDPAMDLRTKALIIVMAAGAAGSLVYGFVGLVEPGLFVYAFQPGQALFFLSWFLAAASGLAIGNLKLPRVVGPVVATVLLVYTFASAHDATRGEINSDNAVKQQLENALKLDPSDREHRIGVGWDSGSDWIDTVADVPQTRGYQQQGVLYGAWQYWLEQALWDPAPNYPVKNFLLDWYAIRDFYGGPAPASVASFEARPDLYVPLATGVPVGDRTFQFLRASPIMSARSTRTALVIGSEASYELVVRAVALSGFDSSMLVPVRGGDYIDDYSPAELDQFSMVILYGFKAHDLSRAFSMIADFVKGGGGLLMEANNSPYEETNSAPDPVPGMQVHKVGIGPAWNFGIHSGPITDGVNFAAFADATYAGGLWGVSYIPDEQLKSWSAPVLLSDGRPVVVAGTLGQGRVVWSGINLPFHAEQNAVFEESRLLAHEISWAAPHNAGSVASTVTFVNPQLRRISVSGLASGVLLKESWFANWHATVNGRTAPVYRAGPDFMYVPIPGNASTPSEVELDFQRSAIEWASDGISALALVGLVFYAAGGRRRLTKFTRRKRPSAPDRAVPDRMQSAAPSQADPSAFLYR